MDDDVTRPIDPFDPDDTATDGVPTAADDDVVVFPAKQWWVGPVLVMAVLALIAVLAGVASRHRDDDDIASASSTTSTTLEFTTQTTGGASTASPGASGTTSSIGTVTTVEVNNRPISIESQWDPGAPGPGEDITFTVRVRDPDAAPIKEGACGDGNAVAFGDGDSVATSCGIACGSGAASSPAAPGSANFTYHHVYQAAGTYVVTMVYSSGTRCTDAYASTNKLTFNITVS